MRLALILVLIVHVSFGQELKAEFVKQSYYSNGKKIRKNADLSREREVFIEKDGQLNIRYRDRWTMIVKPGKHRIDSLLKSELDKPDFKINDSIYNVLEDKGLRNCKFNYQTEQAGVYGHHIVDDIEIKMARNVSTSEDTLTIKWENPILYSGKYYVTITNLFHDYVGLETTEAMEMTLNLKPYKRHVGLLYKITAEDCRESQLYIIRIE